MYTMQENNDSELAVKNLELVLETHYCDLDDATQQDSRLEKAAKAYFQDKNLEHHVKIFESLSDEKRLKILHLLTFREMCNCELTAATESTQPNLTYHIKKLEESGLVKKRRDGKYIYYTLNQTEKLKKLLLIIGKRI